MTTREQAAREWANERCPGQDETDIVWSMCVDDFLAGCEHEARQRDKWVSVKERLPEGRIEVLGIIAGGIIPNPIVQMFIDRGQWKTIDHWPGAKPLHPPTHWQPLPEPPKGGE